MLYVHLRTTALKHRQREGIICKDTLHIPNHTPFRHQRSQRTRHREKARPDGLEQKETPRRRLFHEPARLPCVDRQRLLAQDVLARAQTEHRMLEVVRVRRGDVDDVDVAVRGKVGVAAVGVYVRGVGALALVLHEGGGAGRGVGRGDRGEDVLDVAGAPCRGWVEEEIAGEGWGETDDFSLMFCSSFDVLKWILMALERCWGFTCSLCAFTVMVFGKWNLSHTCSNAPSCCNVT